MSSQNEMVKFQAEHHPLVTTEGFATDEDFCLYLMHRKAYEVAALFTADKAVLDFGCNNGYGTNILAAKTADVIGIDVSQAAIDSATQQYVRSGLRFMCVDGGTLPFSDGEFDVVTSFQVVEHLTDPDAYLKEIKRVLRPSGILLLTTPQAAIRLDPGMKPWNPFHVREYRAHELESQIARHFKTVLIRGLFASEPVYSVEYRRCQSGLADARRSNKIRLPSYTEVRTFAINAIKAALPESSVNQVRAWIRSRSSVGTADNKSIDAHATTACPFESKYSTNDFFYCNENFDKALDLLAIASEASDLKLPMKL